MYKLDFCILVAFVFLTTTVHEIYPKSISQNNNVVIDNLSDIEVLKNLFRTKTSMLVMFVSSLKETQSTVKIFREAAKAVKGLGTMVLIDCSNPGENKFCKILKVSPKPLILKHYQNGDFNKDYDRHMIVSSIVNFMCDPTGDLTWEEDPKGVNVIHINEINQLTKLLKKEIQPILIMFYAPWCSFCKQLKLEYNEAATELKDKYILAAMDVNRPKNSIARRQYNITDIPTMLYFENGKMRYKYEGENEKANLIAFMENPTAPAITKENDWSADTKSEIIYSSGFEPALNDEKPVPVMLYHYKKLKPEFEKAALQMKIKKMPGILSALDATKEATIVQKYVVKSYPSIKSFVSSEFQFDVNLRTADKVVNFIKEIKKLPPLPEKSRDEEESAEVEHLTDETFNTFLKKKKHALVMFYVPWCDNCKKEKLEFTAAAVEFEDNPLIAFAAIDCVRYSTVCKIYEVHGYPTLKYFSYLKRKIDYIGGRTSKDFINFLKKPDSPNHNQDEL